MARAYQKYLARWSIQHSCHAIKILCCTTSWFFFSLSKKCSSKAGFEYQIKDGVEVWEVVGVTWWILTSAYRVCAWLVVLHVAFKMGDSYFEKLISSCCIVEPMMAICYDLGTVETSCVCFATIYVTYFTGTNANWTLIPLCNHD